MKPSGKIREIREKEGLSQAAFAKRFGLKESAIRFIESEKQNIQDDFALILEEQYNLSFKWLKTGKGDIYNKPTSDCKDEIKVMIDYENTGSCGCGIYIDDNNCPDYIYLSKFWIKNILKVSTRDLMIIFANGDSMEPTIQDGDMLLIDKTKKDPINGIYLLRFYNQLLVKRIHILPDSIRLYSDNQRYDYIPIQTPDLDGVEIIGKVVWNGNKKTL